MMRVFGLLFLGASLAAAQDMAEAPAEVDDESPVLLLQTAVGVATWQRVIQPPAMLDQDLSPAERLASALPLIWLHVPKTGTSWANALIRLPGVCPEMLKVLGNESFTGGHVTNEAPYEMFFEYPCPGLTASSSPLSVPIPGHHENVGSEFEERYNGHGVTMLRQPEQRVISGLRHFHRGSPKFEIEDLAVSEGCTARMLINEPPWRQSPAAAACFAIPPECADEECVDSVPAEPLPALSPDEVREAQARLQSFVFVGIQEEWQLSVCLIHTMFGGECSRAEFQNTRASPETQAAAQNALVSDVAFAAPEPYDTDVLGDWVDSADRALYETGLEIFHELCEAHGVTPESCEPCYRSAGLL